MLTQNGVETAYRLGDILLGDVQAATGDMLRDMAQLVQMGKYDLAMGRQMGACLQCVRDAQNAFRFVASAKCALLEGGLASVNEAATMIDALMTMLRSRVDVCLLVADTKRSLARVMQARLDEETGGDADFRLILEADAEAANANYTFACNRVTFAETQYATAQDACGTDAFFSIKWIGVA